MDRRGKYPRNEWHREQARKTLVGNKYAVGNKNMAGRVVKEETRQRIREKLLLFWEKKYESGEAVRRRKKISRKSGWKWKHSEETKRKMSESRRGSKSNLWKGGLTKKNALIRASSQYLDWKRKVFERDNWTCVWCMQRGGRLNADHIKPFALYPELRFELSNGRTLCLMCHKKTDTWGGRSRNK